MKISAAELRKRLSERGLRVTPQRINILEAVYILDKHPTVENISDFIRESHPNIATGTIYNVLETLVKNNLIKKVKTDADIMRYDGVVENHHHLYCSECDIIEDYIDKELDEILAKHFKNKEFKGFKIDDIVLQIRGTFDKC